jgi:hypothetical protein
MGPDIRIARVRWAPSEDAIQTLTEAAGVTGVARTAIGAYTISMADTKVKDLECFLECIENDTTVDHLVRVVSQSASAGTIAVTHKTRSLPLRATATWDPGSIASGASELSAAITVTGAALGDSVVSSHSISLAGLSSTAYVSVADAVRVVLTNNTGSAVDLASHTVAVETAGTRVYAGSDTVDQMCAVIFYRVYD